MHHQSFVFLTASLESYLMQLLSLVSFFFKGLAALARLAISQVTQFELTELTAKTQFSQSVLEAAGRQSSQFRGHQTD
jgi:hypothetical protein